VSLDFTAIDFETANSRRGSPCSVGLVKVRDGRIVHETGTLIRPPAELDYFNGFNTSLHGITSKMVANAPRWRDVLPRILEYADSDTLVCHNAGFDISVMRHACTADQIPCPTVDFLCTLVLARRAFRLPSYRLPFVAAECDVDLVSHHEATSDARCAALVAVAMARKQGAGTLRQLADTFSVRIGHVEEGRYAGSACGYSNGRYSPARPEPNPDAAPEHPFYGRVIVFTGSLQSRTRQEAWEDAVKVGGIPERSVTKQTNVLVTGDISPVRQSPGAITSGKAAKAFDLQEKGQDIEVMTEDDFIRHL
jgi:DNA polymerase III epsilon subunit-like protein